MPRAQPFAAGVAALMAPCVNLEADGRESPAGLQPAGLGYPVPLCLALRTSFGIVQASREGSFFVVAAHDCLKPWGGLQYACLLEFFATHITIIWVGFFSPSTHVAAVLHRGRGHRQAENCGVAGMLTPASKDRILILHVDDKWSLGV